MIQEEQREMMNNNELTDQILSTVRQPLWGIWYVREKLGEGSSSVVFRGEAVRRNKTEYSAVKVEPITAGDMTFRDESQKAAYLDEQFGKVSHESTLLYELKDCPNVVNYKDEYYSDLVIGGNKEGYFFIRRMELLTGVQDMINSQKFAYTEENVRKLAAGIGAGLSAAHAKGILHRDIAPENFYLSGEGKYKLGGFNTWEGSDYVGPEDYMAPEVYRAKGNAAEKYTPQAEVFSFGMCLYQLMNRGLLPFEGNNTTREAAIDRRMLGAQLPPPCDASKEFADIILKACSPEPSARYSTAGQLLADLNALNRAELAPAGDEPTVYLKNPDQLAIQDYDDLDGGEDVAYTRPTRKSRQNRNLMILIIIALIALIAVMILGITLALKNNKSSDSSSDTAQVPAASEETATTEAQEATEPDTVTEEASTEPTTEKPTEPNESDFVLDKTSITIEVGQSEMPMVIGYPEGTSDADELWTSEDESIATVDGIGNIYGVAPGQCDIVLTSAADSSQFVKIRVTVKEKEMNEFDPSESPAPEKVDYPGLTYIDGILVANKTYSVPRDYDPGDILPIAQERFNALQQAAAEDGLNLWICSGYRSYDYQESLYNGYVASDGQANADTYSARPGHSEHQTGLAMDINMADSAFAGTPEAIWLAEHCYEYGFIIRYPADKVDITGYKYEPWHLRYVGGELAKELTEKGICLEEYLGIDSKYSE